MSAFFPVFSHDWWIHVFGDIFFCSFHFKLSKCEHVSFHVVCSCIFHGFVVSICLKYSFFNRIRSGGLFCFFPALSFWVEKVDHRSFRKSPQFSAINHMILCDVWQDQFRFLVIFAEYCKFLSLVLLTGVFFHALPWSRRFRAVKMMLHLHLTRFSTAIFPFTTRWH